jgi:putative membrane protein
MLELVFGWLTSALLVAIAVIHSVIAYKEIFDWEASAERVIGMPPEEARASARVGRNQGLSNAFLAAGAAWAAAEWWFGGPAAGRPLATFFAVCVLAAGLFGWKTFQRPGFLTKQALPAAATLIAAWLPALIAAGDRITPGP